MTKPERLAFSPEVAKRIAEITGLDADDQRAAELAPQVQTLRDGLVAMDDLDLTGIEPATIAPLRKVQP